ncbi:GDSL-type esterase/lipase family protein [Flagellimonas sp.]|uniref:GDSL-type esterase/lipase family protein n=1 Tax=Flagellimonas sp. TaxID=2058762 RepID=UPI003B51D06F
MEKLVYILSLFMLLNCSTDKEVKPEELGPTTTMVKILPLGNSITEGEYYRYPLWKKLVDAEYQHVFIGNRGDEDHGLPGYKGQGFNNKHQAVSGISAIDIANNQIDAWMNDLAVAPDVVLVHLGTNDAEVIFEEAATLEDVEQSMRTIIQALRNKNSNVKILLAQIIPLNTEFPTQNNLVAQINGRWSNLASELNTSQSPIVLVDCNTGFSAVDLEDAWHPNVQGSEKMAQRFADAILQK